MMYLLWRDDSKKSANARIADGVVAFQERFRCSPAFILVNEQDMTTDIPCVRLGTDEGVVVRAGEFWLGPVEGVGGWTHD